MSALFTIASPAFIRLTQCFDNACMAIIFSCILTTFSFEVVVPIEGQIGMWPLNERFQGKNLFHGKTDIALHGVSYSDVTKPVAVSSSTLLQ